MNFVSQKFKLSRHQFIWILLIISISLIKGFLKTCVINIFVRIRYNTWFRIRSRPHVIKISEDLRPFYKIIPLSRLFLSNYSNLSVTHINRWLPRPKLTLIKTFCAMSLFVEVNFSLIFTAVIVRRVFLFLFNGI